MKRLSALLLTVVMVLSLSACGADVYGVTIVTTSGSTGSTSAPEQNAPAEPAVPDISAPDISEPDVSAPEEQTPDYDLPVEGEYYYDLENVVLYLELYDELPDNYITKKEAQDLGWSGGSVERYMDGAAIGGDRFGNREGVLPKGSYTECDLYTNGQNSRGAYRLVFSDDGHYYYTEDHYESFTEYFVTEDWAVVEG